MTVEHEVPQHPVDTTASVPVVDTEALKVIPPAPEIEDALAKREYNLQSFANGDFVYPRQQQTDTGDVDSPVVPPAPAEERELGELTPITSIRTLDDPPAEPVVLQSASDGDDEDIDITAPTAVSEIQATDETHFGRDACVLAFERGSQNCEEHVTFKFEVTAEQKANLSTWVERNEWPP